MCFLWVSHTHTHRWANLSSTTCWTVSGLKCRTSQLPSRPGEDLKIKTLGWVITPFLLCDSRLQVQIKNQLWVCLSIQFCWREGGLVPHTESSHSRPCCRSLHVWWTLQGGMKKSIMYLVRVTSSYQILTSSSRLLWVLSTGPWKVVDGPGWGCSCTGPSFSCDDVHELYLWLQPHTQATPLQRMWQGQLHRRANTTFPLSLPHFWSVYQTPSFGLLT